MNKKSSAGLTIVKILFIAVLVVEGYFCYKWLIEPLIPAIKDIWGNQGMPTISYSGDISHPLNSITIFGMDSRSAGTLIINTIIRFTVFSILFGVTTKVFNIIKSVFK